MRRRGSAMQSIASSPTLVGAITTLIIVVAVFLAYNANSGLPFVPVYRVSVLVPNGARLTHDNEVRIGGTRVGVVESIDPVETTPSGQLVSNQFGDITVDVVKPARLLVPSSKSLAGPPAPLASPIDHFTCYKVKRSRGSARFAKVSVSIETQFETVTLDVTKPLRLCAPTNKNDEAPGTENNLGHLLCYRVHAQTGFPSTAVFVNNQFGQQHYVLSQRREFCVPSLKNGYGSPSRAFLERAPDLLD